MIRVRVGVGGAVVVNKLIIHFRYLMGDNCCCNRFLQ